MLVLICILSIDFPLSCTPWRTVSSAEKKCRKMLFVQAIELYNQACTPKTVDRSNASLPTYAASPPTRLSDEIITIGDASSYMPLRSLSLRTLHPSSLRSPHRLLLNCPPASTYLQIHSIPRTPHKPLGMAKNTRSANYHYTLDEQVAAFPKIREDLLQAYPEITDTICGGFIFSTKPLKAEEHVPESGEPRVLILHRAATLPTNQYPGTWDYPGGRFETSDDNIFDAVAREVHEETGLHVFKFNPFASLVTWTEGPEYGSRKWGKFCFIVEVAEMDKAEDLESLHATYPPDEHQGHAWVTVDELGGYDFIGADKGDSIKAAFSKL